MLILESEKKTDNCIFKIRFFQPTSLQKSFKTKTQ